MQNNGEKMTGEREERTREREKVRQFHPNLKRTKNMQTSTTQLQHKLCQLSTTNSNNNNRPQQTTPPPQQTTTLPQQTNNNTNNHLNGICYVMLDFCEIKELNTMEFDGT